MTDLTGLESDWALGHKSAINPGEVSSNHPHLLIRAPLGTPTWALGVVVTIFSDGAHAMRNATNALNGHLASLNPPPFPILRG